MDAKTFTVLLILFRLGATRSQPNLDQLPAIEDFKEGPFIDGSYHFRFSTENGIFREEMAVPTDLGTLLVVGAYSYVAPNGQLIDYEYYADENGYRAFPAGTQRLPEIRSFYESLHFNRPNRFSPRFPNNRLTTNINNRLSTNHNNQQSINSNRSPPSQNFNREQQIRHQQTTLQANSQDGNNYQQESQQVDVVNDEQRVSTGGQTQSVGTGTNPGERASQGFGITNQRRQYNRAQNLLAEQNRRRAAFRNIRFRNNRRYNSFSSF